MDGFVLTAALFLTGVGLGAYFGKAGKLRFLTADYLWSIGIFSSEGFGGFSPAAGAVNPVLTAAQVRDVRARYVADPFMIRERDRWHLFFEVFNEKTRKGEIGTADSLDGLRWMYRRIVLAEPHHLSYPFLFAWEGSYYMVPESEAARSVRLYQAEEFPLKWRLKKILLEGKPFHDPTPFFHEGRWWMFVGLGPKRHDTLLLYHAGSLEGPWEEHPQSPVVRGNPHGARPGGRVITEQGRLIRLGQEACPVYGTGLKAFEIIRLTPTLYEEREAELALFRQGVRPVSWNSAGMHHLDAHPAEGGRWLACVDGQRKVPTVRWEERYS